MKPRGPIRNRIRRGRRYYSNARITRPRSESKGVILTQQTMKSELPAVGPDGMTDDEYFRHFDRLVEVAVWLRQFETPLTMPPDAKRVAESTFQAVAYVLRTYGMRRLNDAWLTNHLANFPDVQIQELVAALGRMRPKYPAITNELIAEVAKLKGQEGQAL
jgi:hypothetical protein